MSRGLNGETVFEAKNVRVGTVPGEEYGYKQACPVTVSVAMERLDRQDTYETVDHEHVTRPLDFSITSDVWQPRMGDIVSGGATVDPLREVIAAGTYAPGWDEAKVAALVEAAEWHLNAMTAGCAHQEPVRDDNGRADLDLTPACPVTGYKYGHAWLVRMLPDGFAEQIISLF